MPAQIIYDAFESRFHSPLGAIIFLYIIFVSFFFCGLSVSTTAARVVRKILHSLSLGFSFPFSFTFFYDNNAHEYKFSMPNFRGKNEHAQQMIV